MSSRSAASSETGRPLQGGAPWRAVVFALALAAPAVGAADPLAAAQPPAESSERGAAERPARSMEPTSAAGADERDVDGEVLDRGWDEQVVVTATRSDRRAGDIPRHLTVVTGEELELTPELGIGEVVLRMPAINLQGDKSTLVAARLDGGLAFRGLGGTAQSRGLVLVDGFPLNDPTGGYLLWTRVPVDALERIEVIPGSGGVWGNLALGGTLNMITAAPAENLFAASLRLGEHDTRQGGLSYSDLGASWSGSLVVDKLDTDGFHLLPSAEIRPIDVPWRKDFVTLHGKLGRSFSPARSLHLSGTWFEEDRVLGTRLSTDSSDEAAFTATLDVVSGRGDTWQARGYARDVGLEEARPRAVAGGTAEAPNGASSNPSRAYGLSALWFAAGAGRHALSAGTDLQRNTIEAFQDSSFVGAQPTVLTVTEGEQRLAGLFVQDTVRPSPRLLLLLDARFDWVRTLDGRRVETDLVSGERDERVLVDSNTETAWSPNLGLVYEVSGELRVRASAYTGFRAGTPSELFITNTATSKTAANPRLEPEELVGLESGVDYSPSSRVTLRATVYWNEGRNLIERIFIGRAGPGGEVVEPCGFLIAGGQCRERRNLGEARTHGLELDQEVRLGSRWRLHLSGTLLDTEITDSPADPDLVGKRVLRTPNQAGSLSLHYTHPRWFSALARARYVGARYDDSDNEVALPERLLVDVSVARELSARWRLFAGVQNLFDDRRLVDVSATTGPELEAPRVAQIGVRFRSR